MNIIKLDVDGVIRDTFSVMCNLYNMKFGTYMVPEDIFAYDVNVSFPLVQEQLGVSAAEWFFQIHSEDCFLNAPAFDGVADAIRKLRQQGDKIVICTYQPTYAGRINTIMFLENNGIEFDELHLTEQKWAVLGDVMNRQNDTSVTLWEQRNFKKPQPDLLHHRTEWILFYYYGFP
jgi:hypothetical protein